MSDKSTQLIHHAYKPPAGFDSVQPGVHKASTIIFPSVVALRKAGDEVLVPDNAYGPNKAFAQHELAAWGISTRYYDAMQPADLAAKLSNKTRLVWLEAPGSITLEFPDLPALVAVVKAHSQRH